MRCCYVIVWWQAVPEQKSHNGLYLISLTRKQIYQVCSIGDMGLFDYTSWYMLMITVYYYKSEYVFDT
jgi:hypothetical protein